MKAHRSFVTLGLLVLVLLAILGLIWTRDSRQSTTGKQVPGRRTPLVDEQPLQTARNMAKLVSSADEQRIAQQALKLGDHEVDLAFADALRDATEQPPATTAQSRELYARVSKAEALMQADQSKVDQLKKRIAAADSNHQSGLQQQADIVQAQMGLDQDELDDAKEDLSRSGIDPLSRIQHQFARYQAAQQADAARPQFSQSSAAGLPGDLVGRTAAWRAARRKIDSLQDAQNEAAAGGAKLTQAHDALEKQVNEEQADQQALAQEASSQLDSGAGQEASGTSGETAAALLSLHTVSVDQKDLADLDKRVQDSTELRDAYGNWIVLVKSDQLAALHGILKSALSIVLIILAMYLAGLLLEHLLGDLSPEQTRFRTLRIIVRISLQAVSLLLILFVIFGVPDQLTTVIGLAGAGLTVALQDFIISFFGWFVLMGRNGMRVGDWVEIDGIAGEVIEIGLLRTVLLETGTSADAGHPTGRKVTLMNSYAIQGRFFNFSTSGQWLWDEVQVTVPASQDPYPVIEAIRQMVVKETEADTKAAEEEWKQATRHYRVHSVSAEPAVNLRPTGEGIEVHVRYIARADERYATRTRLYEAVVDLLHRRGVEAAASVPAVSGKR